MVGLIAIRRPVQRRLFAGSGVQEWRAVARRLPWRDRGSLYIATSRGRATSTRLAGLAVQRGEAMVAAHDRSKTKMSKLRWLFWTLAALGVVNLAIHLAQLVTGDGGSATWIGLSSALMMVVLGLGYLPLMEAQARLVRRSVELNRAQIDA